MICSTMIAPLSFKGKLIAVTGAGRGLGKVLVKSLLKNEGSVIAISRTKDNLVQLQREYPGVKTIQVDLSNYNETRKAIQSMEAVDMLVNNAAINIPGHMMKVTEEEFTLSFNSNVISVLNVTQIVAAKMIEHGKTGSIVNISSIAEKMPIDRQGLYAMTKAALSMLSRSLAQELGPHNIRVNCVSPGLFPSDMSKKALNNPKSHMVKNIIEISSLRRIGTPEEIANAVLFMLHESSSYITGQSIFISGG